MHWYEVSKFVEEVECIRDFVAELAANESDSYFLNTRRNTRLASFDLTNVPIDNFETQLSNILRFANTVDKDLAARIRAVEEEYKISSRLMQIASVIHIARSRSNRLPSGPLFVDFALAMLPSFFTRLLRREEPIFSWSNIPIDELFAGLQRVIHLSKELYDIGYERIKDDDDLFKPSKVNKENVIIYIENAENLIRLSEEIGHTYRKLLLEHLQEAKTEFSHGAPDFKKVIGALVVIATLLSGLAAAPEALGNINKAISSILSNSIDRVPNQEERRQLFHDETPFSQEI